MNCEHVEELLSPYLDNTLAPEERREVAIHLQACTQCSSILAEYRQNDLLLARLPRVSPDSALRERIFSSPEWSELTATSGSSADQRSSGPSTQPRLPAQQQDTGGRPRLVALPGGRNAKTTSAQNPQQTTRSMKLSSRSHHTSSLIRIVAIAAVILLALVTSGLLGLTFWNQHTRETHAGGITPPAAPPAQGGPLAAGIRFVFLRDGALWSTLTGSGNAQPERLTPPGVQVAASWRVSPAMPGHVAGDQIAYIDLQKARLHIIRSDGQQDTVIAQSLLSAHTQPSTVWDTPVGERILNGLTWSKDGSMLAFVADPTGAGKTSLYVFTFDTGKLQQVPLPQGSAGAALQPVWSPDSIRLAFELELNGIVNILDYNTQNQGVLNITTLATAQGNSVDSILTLNWAASTSIPTITWSLGAVGHVRSIWIHRVGAGGTINPELLLSGDYVQASYNRGGDNGQGSWLLVAYNTGQAGDIWRIDATTGALPVRLSVGKQVSFATWSPDGNYVVYLDALSAGLGTCYIVNALTGSSSLIANGVSIDPAPVWSADSQALAFSTGKHIGIAQVLSGKSVSTLGITGFATALAWSPAAPTMLVVALSDTQRGIYLVDTRHNTTQRVDKLTTDSVIQWTEIP